MVASGDVDKGGHRLAGVLAPRCLEKFPQGGAYPFADESTTTAAKNVN
jgi:hypothetical protein